MPQSQNKGLKPHRARALPTRENLAILMLLAGLAVGSIAFGAQTVLMSLVLGLPATFLMTGVIMRLNGAHPAQRTDREPLCTALDAAIRTARRRSAHTACILLQIDESDDLIRQFNPDAAEDISRHTLNRLDRMLRRGDQIFELNTGKLAIALRPSRRLTIDAALHIARRLHAAAEEPVSLNTVTACPTVSTGLCLDTQLTRSTGRALVDAAELALDEARRSGPSSIRAFAPDMRRLPARAHLADDELSRALNHGEFLPWFQPQISTDNGALSGVEALARWNHPTRGILGPADFLPLLEQTGQLEALGRTMLEHCLTTLREWQASGLYVPRIGLNLSPTELRQPGMVNHISWELDRHEIAPDRLAIEVLETVVAQSPGDTVTRNINALARLGCLIDLDDFGTGHASLSSLRRLAVGRLKIDRSFVTGIDGDRDQQRMVSAILSMSERLGLETLAEGVETAGEHAMLAQLGCGHVQGFGIGRPMPAADMPAWAARHHNRLAQLPGIARTAG